MAKTSTAVHGLGTVTALWQFPLRSYRNTYRLTTLVETGTSRGDGVVSALLAGFPRILTCDLAREPVDRMFEKYRDIVDDAAVTFYHGDSVTMLPRMIAASCDEPVCWWLDAHVDPSLFDAHLTPAQSPTPAPLPAELEILIRSRDLLSCDVVLIDDLQLYVEDRWIGSEWAERWRLPRPVWRTADEIVRRFPGHDGTIVPDHALVLLPKRRC